MSMTTYHFTKINDAISDPKGDRAHAIDYHIDSILHEHEDSDHIEAMKRIASELTEYVNRNLTSKFKTKDYARRLRRELKKLCGERY